MQPVSHHLDEIDAAGAIARMLLSAASLTAAVVCEGGDGRRGDARAGARWRGADAANRRFAWVQGSSLVARFTGHIDWRGCGGGAVIVAGCCKRHLEFDGQVEGGLT